MLVRPLFVLFLGVFVRTGEIACRTEACMYLHHGWLFREKGGKNVGRSKWLGKASRAPACISSDRGTSLRAGGGVGRPGDQSGPATVISYDSCRDKSASADESSSRYSWLGLSVLRSLLACDLRSVRIS